MDVLRECEIQCPYCGEMISITIETSQGDYSTIEDCAVCCRPIQFGVRCRPGEIIAVEVTPA